MSEQLLTVAIYSSPDQAFVAASALEAAGFYVHLHDVEMVRLNWLGARAYGGGIKLRVEDDQALDAGELLLGSDVVIEDFDAGAPVWIRGDIRCTTCGSDEVYRGLDRFRRFAIWYLLNFLIAVAVAVPQLFAVVALWSLGPFFILLSERWHCRVCGTTWPHTRPPRPKYLSPAAPAAPA